MQLYAITASESTSGFLRTTRCARPRRSAIERAAPRHGRAAPCLKMLLAMAVATSIDALATGIILPGAVGASTVPLMLLSVGIIGVITLILCTAGVFIGKKFGCLLSSKAELAGGIVLILIGVKIFVDHMFLSAG